MLLIFLSLVIVQQDILYFVCGTFGFNTLIVQMKDKSVLITVELENLADKHDTSVILTTPFTFWHI